MGEILTVHAAHECVTITGSAAIIHPQHTITLGREHRDIARPFPLSELIAGPGSAMDLDHQGRRALTAGQGREIEAFNHSAVMTAPFDSLLLRQVEGRDRGSTDRRQPPALAGRCDMPEIAIADFCLKQGHNLARPVRKRPVSQGTIFKRDDGQGASIDIDTHQARAHTVPDGDDKALATRQPGQPVDLPIGIRCQNARHPGREIEQDQFLLHIVEPILAEPRLIGDPAPIRRQARMAFRPVIVRDPAKGLARAGRKHQLALIGRVGVGFG